MFRKPFDEAPAGDNIGACCVAFRELRSKEDKVLLNQVPLNATASLPLRFLRCPDKDEGGRSYSILQQLSSTVLLPEQQTLLVFATRQRVLRCVCLEIT